MEIVIILFFAPLVAAWLVAQTISTALVCDKEIEERRRAKKDAELRKHSNFIVIKGRVYHPERVGRETDCKTERPLYAHCEKGSHSLCMALQHPYEDVIMVEDGREE